MHAIELPPEQMWNLSKAHHTPLTDRAALALEQHRADTITSALHLAHSPCDGRVFAL